MKKSSIIPRPVTEYDLRLLRIFKVVVENGGFAAAETELGVTRSTISIHISNLETRLKVKLCLRGRGGFSLTKEGHVIYHAVLELFDSLDEFSLLASSLGGELSGEITILCSDLLNTHIQQKLAAVIKHLHAQAPDLHVTLDRDTIANIEKSLANDKAHVGLYPAYRTTEMLSYEQLHSEPIYLCCSKSHPLFNKLDSDISNEELAKVPAIHPGVDIDSVGREQLKKLNLAAKAYQFDTRKSMILSGCYVGYLPQSYIQAELNTGEIRLIKPSELTYDFTLSLVHRRTPREQAKVDLLQTAFNAVYEMS